MKKITYSLGLLVMLFLSPVVALSQGYIDWPAVEDPITVPGGSVLNTFIAADTAGVGNTAWLARNRVYVLLAGQKYGWTTGGFTLNAASRSIYIRGEYGKDYTIPSTPFSKQKPILRSVTSPLVVAKFTLNGVDNVFAMKNVCSTVYDEFINPTDLRLATGTFVTCGVNSRANVYFDSCIITGQLTVVNYGGRSLSPLTTDGKVLRIQNCIIGDDGSLQRSNMGAGRVVDLRSVGVDTLDMFNNTIFNVIDRVVRYLGSPKPIFSVKFNHNTAQNCLSYHGFVALGWIDSVGNGPFEIKNNLLIDVNALGADTDKARQVEFVDNPDLDVNGLGAFSTFISRRNTDPHITPWDIAKNYYFVSDSGKAIRDYETPMHQLLYTSASPERLLTSDMARQVDANGGNSATAFTKLTNFKFVSATEFPSKMCRWYFAPNSPGYIPTTLCGPIYGTIDSAVNAGEGKTKFATAPMPNFAQLTQYTQWFDQWYQHPYDFKRMTVDSVMEWADFSYEANVDLANEATDGGQIGSTMWAPPTVGVDNDGTTGQLPSEFALNQNYPNPFNPSTTIQYTLSTESKVTLKVFNLLGQVVSTLVNEKQAAGPQSITFDASRLSSGIYFYQITAGSFSATKKMILMK
jgi:hypothetical protein